MVTDKPVTSQTFCKIIAEIEKNGKGYIMFGDNAALHTSSYTKRVMYEHDTELICNVAYCPDLNQIEKFFLQIKTKYKQERFNHIINRTFWSPTELILKVCREADRDKIVANICQAEERWK